MTLMEKLQRLHNDATEQVSIAAMRYADLSVRFPQNQTLLDSQAQTLGHLRSYERGIFDAMSLVANHDPSEG